MSDIQVFGIPGSPFLRSVEITLREKGLDYQLHAMRPGEHKSEDYLKRHPFGRVPAFEHDGFSIYETQAILRYLDEVFPSPPLTPGNPKARADEPGDRDHRMVFLPEGRRANRVQPHHRPEASGRGRRRSGDCRRNAGRAHLFR
jgi:glutathione S-transferase